MKYGMFTDVGDCLVHGIVQGARSRNLTWEQTYELLKTIGGFNGFHEATDTAVLESVYTAVFETVA